jgi:hypothetical protein
MSLKLAQAIYLRTSSGGFAIFAAIRRAWSGINTVGLRCASRHSRGRENGLRL